MVEAKSVTKHFRTSAAVHQASFSIAAGQTVGLVGQNGAGKSTLLHMLSGCLLPTQGEVLIGGIAMRQQPLRAKMLLGYMPEKLPLYDELTVYEYLSFCCGIKRVQARDIRRHVQQVMALTGIAAVAGHLLGTLSRGWRQRVGLAQALCADPPLLLLDEPTSGFDPQQAAEFRALLKSLQGKTILLSSHLLTEVASLCDRILILHEGRLIRDLPWGRQEGSGVQKIRLQLAGDIKSALAAIRSFAGVTQARQVPSAQGPELLLAVQDMDAFTRRLHTYCAASQTPIRLLQPDGVTLEETYFQAIREDALRKREMAAS